MCTNPMARPVRAVSDNAEADPVAFAADALVKVFKKAGIVTSQSECIALIASRWKSVCVAAHTLHDAIVAETNEEGPKE